MAILTDIEAAAAALYARTDGYVAEDEADLDQLRRGY
jgi:hypothetical protein